MSIVKLLAEYPNYSARKVRRLAKQISILEEAIGVFAVGEGSGIIKGIMDDLMELNLQRAESEIVVTPETIEKKVVKAPIKVPNMVPLFVAEDLYGRQGEDWIYIDKYRGHEFEVNRTQVTPIDQAMRALEEFERGQRAAHNEVDYGLIAKTKGIVTGSAFTTDRIFLKAEEAEA